MIQEFNFGFNIKDFIIIHTELSFVHSFYETDDNNKYRLVENTIILPQNTILRIENITLGGRFKRNAVDIVFTFLVKKNKHLRIEYKIPNKFTYDVYELNGLKYTVLKDEEVDKKIDSLIRKGKIENLLTNEA